MSTFSPGDSVLCKIFYNHLCHADSLEYESILPFYIIAAYENDYLALTPDSHFISNAFFLSKKMCKEYNLHSKYADSDVCYLTDYHVYSVRSKITGLCCLECGVHCEYADCTRLDKNGNAGYVCWSCRNYKHYK